ncbi:MAG: T9SS type A sorting domain-containing protein [Saprospiraceae bacterium]|nr:T9SS type A sorting domain-containing protein [Saprospiraceae bacterium]
MKKIFLLIIIAFFQLPLLHAQPFILKSKSISDISKGVNFEKNKIFHHQTSGTKGSWIVQFNKSLIAGGNNQAGVETDGTFIYTTMWNSDTIVKYDMLAHLIEKFTITGVSNIRDLAYDGTYFYGGNVDSIIYKMNFSTKTLVGKISCPSGTEVRSIAYDDINDGFWVSNWASEIVLVNKSGVPLNTIPALSHELTNMYGSAFDNITPNGPYLWVFNQAGNYCDIVQISISTKEQTGLIHDASLDVAINSIGAVAGGLFSHTDSLSGTTILGGLYQGIPNGVFAYTLSSVYVAKDVAVTKLLSPVTSCGLSSNEKIKARIENFGYDTLVDLQIYFVYDTLTYMDTLPFSLNPYDSYDYMFDVGLFMAGLGNYEIKVFTSLPNDEDLSNDTITEIISNVSPYPSPYSNGFEPTDDLTGWKVEDGNTDDYSWYYSTTGGNTNPSCYVYSWNPNAITSADDWLFSTCLNLVAGKQYAVKFLTKVAISTYPESMELAIGTQPYSGAMTKTIRDLSDINSENYIVVFDSFSVATSGVYYLGWHVYSAADDFMLYIDDIVIDESVGIQENSNDQIISIYPNPAKDVIYIKSNQEIKNIIIYNAIGQMLLNRNLKNKSLNIDISEFDKGMNYIRIETDKGITIKKVGFIN